MIYVMGDLTSAVKKEYKDTTVPCSSIQVLIDKLPIDPDTSQMNVLAITTNAISNVSGESLIRAILTKHPKVVVVCFYRNNTDRVAYEEIEDVPNVFLHQVNKTTDNTAVKRCIDESIEKALLTGNIDLPQSSQAVASPVGSSVDIFEQENKMVNEGLVWQKTPQVEPQQPKPQEKKKFFDFTPGGVIAPETATITTVDTWEPEQVAGGLPTMGYDAPPSRGIDFSQYERPDKELTMRVAEAAESLDIERLSSVLEQNSVVRELMRESEDFSTAQQAIGILNSQIESVFSDTRLTPSQRMEKIRALCADRSRYKGVTNHLYVTKFLDVIESITRSARDCTEKMRDEYKKRYSTPEITDVFFSNGVKLQGLIDDRLKGQLAIAESITRLRKIYLLMDEAKDRTIGDIKESEPSKNAVINSALKPIKDMFIPQNTNTLIRAIIEALDTKKISFAQAEADLGKLFEEMFQLYDLNEQAISTQDKLLRILESQKVEDIVVCDNILKHKLRTIIGPDNVGRTATAVCIATAQARTDNVLLIDLSLNSKLDRYIQEYTPLTEFYQAQTKDRFLVVKKTQKCIFNDFKFEEALKAAAPHYRYIYVLIGIPDRTEYEIMKKISMSMNFVCNATLDKLDELSPVIASFNEDNTAQIVTLINCEVNALDILEMLKLDPLQTKLIQIPFFKEIQQAGIRKVNPCNDKMVADFFNEVYA